MFTMQWRWTPTQVWALTLREFCMYADLLDAIAEQRKKENQRMRTKGRRHG